MKTHVSLGMKYPLNVMSLVVLERKTKSEESDKKTIYMLKKQIYCCQNFRSYQCGMVKGTYEA